MTLAINGGKPIRTRSFPAYNPIGNEEKAMVVKIMDSGILSGYLGSWHEDFYGGPEVRALEAEWASYFDVKHAVTVNSCTSGLYAAVGAIAVEPGDEIIVSPYTMTASATAPLVFNAIPVFADIEEDTFCLDPHSVESCITSKTKGIIVVDIFGQPYDSENINKLAKKYGIKIIEDAAQAPGAYHKTRFAGTLGDVGVYSLNYHKHIHCGEGGIVVTNDDNIAERVRLIRNHAEAVVDAKGVSDITNMIGFNFRLPEMEAGIVRCQLKKLKDLIEERRKNCEFIAKRLKQIPAISAPVVRKNCTHVYYVQPFKFFEEIAGVCRDVFLEAVKAELSCTYMREKEGVMIYGGYIKPLYLQSIFQKKIAYGSKGFPFKNTNVCYDKGICPITERMFEKELFYHSLMTPGMTKIDLEDVSSAFEKVWDSRTELKKIKVNSK